MTEEQWTQAAVARPTPATAPVTAPQTGTSQCTNAQRGCEGRCSLEHIRPTVTVVVVTAVVVTAVVVMVVVVVAAGAREVRVCLRAGVTFPLMTVILPMPMDKDMQPLSHVAPTEASDSTSTVTLAAAAVLQPAFPPHLLRMVVTLQRLRQTARRCWCRWSRTGSSTPPHRGASQPLDGSQWRLQTTAAAVMVQRGASGQRHAVLRTMGLRWRSQWRV